MVSSRIIKPLLLSFPETTVPLSIVIAITLSCSLLACSGSQSSDSTSQSSKPASAIIGPNGGSLTDSLGNQVIFPPGSLAGETTITVIPLRRGDLSSDIQQALANSDLHLLSAFDLTATVGDFLLPIQAKINAEVGTPQGDTVAVIKVDNDEDGDTFEDLTLIEGAVVFIDKVQTASPPFPGITRPGRYLFLSTPTSFTFLQGRISGNALPASEKAFVRSLALPGIVSKTNSNRSFVTAVPSNRLEAVLLAMNATGSLSGFLRSPIPHPPPAPPGQIPAPGIIVREVPVERPIEEMLERLHQEDCTHPIEETIKEISKALSGLPVGLAEALNIPILPLDPTSATLTPSQPTATFLRDFDFELKAALVNETNRIFMGKLIEFDMAQGLATRQIRILQLPLFSALAPAAIFELVPPDVADVTSFDTSGNVFRSTVEARGNGLTSLTALIAKITAVFSVQYEATLKLRTKIIGNPCTNTLSNNLRADLDISRQPILLGPSTINVTGIQLIATPSSLAFTALLGETPPSKVINITSAFPNATKDWTASANVPWIQITPANGRTPASATVSVSTVGLSVGTHQGTLRLVDPSATSSPVIVPVTFTIPTLPPKCGASPIFYAPGQSCKAWWFADSIGTPATLSFQTSNAGVVTVTGSPVTLPPGYSGPFPPADIYIATFVAQSLSGTAQVQVLATHPDGFSLYYNTWTITNSF